eukprot:6196468-Pleurochrysis_carterae.AAC.1
MHTFITLPAPFRTFAQILYGCFHDADVRDSASNLTVMASSTPSPGRQHRNYLRASSISEKIYEGNDILQDRSSACEFWHSKTASLYNLENVEEIFSWVSVVDSLPVLFRSELFVGFPLEAFQTRVTPCLRTPGCSFFLAVEILTTLGG